MGESGRAEIQGRPTRLELSQIQRDLRYALESGEGHLATDAIPRLIEANHRCVAREITYWELESEFMKVLARHFHSENPDDDPYLGTKIYCPFCDWKSRLIFQEEADRPNDQNLLSALFNHLKAKHHFTKIIRRKERPTEYWKLTTYECALCATELKGVISALIHFIEHVWLGEGDYMRLDVPLRQQAP